MLGSGVSSAAGIPTGWEITLDLVRKLGCMRGQPPDFDPQSWYEREFGKEPDYSVLLDELAKTPDHRQQLLREYFEPNDQERADGLKEPTRAHRAIARLNRRGFIKVIMTTNFDRLMERALEEEGVTPVTISSPDQFQSAQPLHLAKCCVLKVHGDYLDPRILNTVAELQDYRPEVNKLLDRVLDDYGLTVCGWSAAYDVALRSAVTRNPSRRYTTYWAQKGEKTDESLKIISSRRAEVFEIGDADTFFESVEDHVDALERSHRPNPLTVATAVSRLKQYLPDPKDGIRLRDLADDVAKDAVNAMSSEIFQIGTPDEQRNDSTERRRNRLIGYADASNTLLQMGVIAGHNAQPEHFDTWSHILIYLATNTPGTGDNLRLGWKAVPATLWFYSLGIGAVVRDRLEFLGHLFKTSINRDRADDLRAIGFLHPNLWYYGMSHAPSDLLTDANGSRKSINVWLHDVLSGPAAGVIANPNLYTYYFDKLEILMALSNVNSGETRKNRLTYDLGGFIERPENTIPILREIENSIERSQDKDNSPFVASGISGERYEDWLSAVNSLKDYLKMVDPSFFLSRLRKNSAPRQKLS